jgi:hypothetical protein
LLLLVHGLKGRLLLYLLRPLPKEARRSIGIGSSIAGLNPLPLFSPQYFLFLGPEFGRSLTLPFLLLLILPTGVVEGRPGLLATYA